VIVIHAIFTLHQQKHIISALHVTDAHHAPTATAPCIDMNKPVQLTPCPSSWTSSCLAFSY
jgi:hypothetical protein